MDVQIVLGVTSREWGGQLADWIADHSESMTVRDRYALEAADALELDYDCLVLDLQASMLTRQLVTRLHSSGRVVVGVEDPSQPLTGGEVEALGIAATVPADAEPRVFAERIMAAVRARPPRREFEQIVADLGTDLADVADVADGSSNGSAAPRGSVTVVTGAAGGVGATELVVELAATLRRRDQAVVLVDADMVAPSLAQRLFVPVTEMRKSNLLTAIDAVHRGSGSLDASIAETAAGCGLVCGLEQPGGWESVAADEVTGVVAELATRFGHTIVHTAAPIEQLPSGRHQVGRRMLELADQVLVVVDANPVGLHRLTRWMWLASSLLEPEIVDVVCNRSDPQTRPDLEREILRTLMRATIDHLPEDSRVRSGAWALELVAPGSFTRAVAALADVRFPESRTVRPRRFARLLGRT